MGIAAIVASLIFVGLQMKQSQQIALSAIYQARSESSMAIRMASLESDVLLSAKTKMRLGNIDDLTAEELTARNDWWSGELIYLENVHYQYINGFLSEEHWNTNLAELESILRDPSWRNALADNCDVFRKSFCAEIMRVAQNMEQRD